MCFHSIRNKTVRYYGTKINVRINKMERQENKKSVSVF
jgi:hypothetical protein